MADMRQLHEFAIKWLEKFKDPNTSDIEVGEHYMGDECRVLGFEMDCGHAFEEKYGLAVNNSEELSRIIDRVDDIPLLGSAIYSQWRYYSHWAYSPAEILEPKNREWFILALTRLAELAGGKPFLFRGEPQKIRIVSNNLGYGLPPEADEEVEQHITINAEGRVWFSAYNFGSIPGKYEKARSKIYAIRKGIAGKVLKSIATYFGNDYLEVFATDIGDWVLEITNTEGSVYKFRGSLCADLEVDGVDLSEMIRKALDMDDLYVFDGNNKPDRVDRVTVEYCRTTRIEGRFRWDYSEKLVIDRASGTLEHIKDVGREHVVSKKYYVPNGVEELLDEIDADDLFGEIEGNPDDVVKDPFETREYTVTVDFKKGPQCVIRGTYDKRALPEYWGDFTYDVWSFMRSYDDGGEMLNPLVYDKVRRRKGEYIYCSVEFGGGWKSYYYIADEDDIEVGDHVVVPVGNEDKHSIAKVVKVEYFTGENAPLPLEKTKHIIRKCTEDDLDPPEEQVACIRTPIEPQ